MKQKMCPFGIETKYELSQLMQIRGNLRESFMNGEKKFYYDYDGLNRMNYAFNYDKQLGAFYDYNGLGNRVGKRFGEPTTLVTPQMSIYDVELNLYTQYQDVIDLSRKYHNLLNRTTFRYQGAESETQWEIDKTRFVYDFGVLSAHEYEGKTMYDDLYYMHDDLGTPVRMMSSKRHLNAFGYDEFGEVVSEIDKPVLPISQPFTFTGYQQDEISNTYFAQAREYQPVVGRFVGEDLVKGIVGLPVTSNQYLYCWNQPGKYVDLNGLYCTREAIDWLEERGKSWNSDRRRDMRDDVRGEVEQLQRDLARVRNILFHGQDNGFPILRTIPAYFLANQRRRSSYDFARRNGLSHARGNLADAYRHFTWMFEETVITGANGARFAGDQNELVFLNNMLRGSSHDYVLAMFDMDAVKDLWNNSLGIEMGSCPNHEGSSSYDAFRYAQANNWLIEHELHVADRLGIVPDSDGYVLGSWNLRANSIKLIDNYGFTVLCLYTREHTRTNYFFGGGN